MSCVDYGSEGVEVEGRKITWEQVSDWRDTRAYRMTSHVTEHTREFLAPTGTATGTTNKSNNINKRRLFSESQ